MAFKPRTSTLDPTRLQDTLLDSKLQQTNNALFQTLVGIIDQLKVLRTDVDGKFGKEEKLDLAIQVKNMLSFRHGGAETGQYVPDLTLVANLTGAGIDLFYWKRIGYIVTVFGKVQVNTTNPLSTTQLRISLPIISYFDFDYEAAGTGASPDRRENAAIYADVGNNSVIMEWESLAPTGVHDFFLHFHYKVIQQ